MAGARLGLALAAALLALATLAGCQAAAPAGETTAPAPRSPLPVDCAHTPDSPRDPMRLYFPAQRVRVDVTRIGLTGASDMDLVPLDRAPAVAGWYCYSPAPGELGPSVMVGHVDWDGSKAAFGLLARARTGERIEVTNRAGAVHAFVITGRQEVPKAAFPFDRVFGDSPVSALTLITCGGVFNHRAQSYQDSIIVYARATTG